MALFHRPTREALRRTALAGLTAAALALSLVGCGGGGVGGSNYTHVEGYFLTPSGGLLQIPSQLVATDMPSDPTILEINKTAPTNAPYFLEMNSHSGDVSNGIQVSATSVSSSGLPAPLPSNEQLATDGGYEVLSSTSASINTGHVLSIMLGFSNSPTLTTEQMATLRILEYIKPVNGTPSWVALPNYYVNPQPSMLQNPTFQQYPSDMSFRTFPWTVTAQFSKFNTIGTTYFAVVYSSPNNPVLGPFFGTYQITFTPTLGTPPSPVYVDAGAEDANSNAALTSDSANPTTDAVTGTISSSGTVSDFTIKEGGVTYTLTGNFTPGTSTTQPMGTGNYTGAGASGTWTATVQ